MLTIQQIKENPERVIERLAVKGFDGKDAINKIIELDDSRRALQLSNDTKAAELNKLSARIGALMKEGKKDEAEEAKAKVASMKQEQKETAERLAAAESEIRNILLTVPNLPCDARPRR